MQEVAGDCGDLTDHPALDLAAAHLDIEQAANLDLAAPDLMGEGDPAELLLVELEVVVVEGSVGLEAPGQRASEVVIKAPLPGLVQEQAHPGLVHFRTDVQILNANK